MTLDQLLADPRVVENNNHKTKLKEAYRLGIDANLQSYLMFVAYQKANGMFWCCHNSC